MVEMLMKLSLMPTWTCSGPTGCHWCHQVLPIVPWSLTEWVCALKHLVPSWQGPCTHKLGFWCHLFAEDVEGLADDAEDPRDGLEALVDDGEAHEDLEPLMKTLMTLQRSWSPLLAIQVILWWPAQIEKNMSKGSCQCKQDPHKMIALVMPFPTVGGTSRGSSWLMRY